MGQRPKLKSDEFLVCKAIVVEIPMCENFDFLIHTTSFLEPDPTEVVQNFLLRIPTARWDSTETVNTLGLTSISSHSPATQMSKRKPR